MGRWAQAQRSGGGPQVAASLAQMTSAHIVGSDIAAIAYNKTINPAGLIPADFNSDPLGALGDTILQTAPSEIEVTFLDTIVGGQGVGYTGATPGFKTPDGINYS